MRSNQLRRYFSAFAHAFMVRVKVWGLKGTPMASAQCGTIRVRLFKVAAVVHKSVLRFKVALRTSYPWKALLGRVLAHIRAVAQLISAPDPYQADTREAFVPRVARLTPVRPPPALA